jgi:uncharacterized repeat protein (TIGR03803 family)
MKRHCNVPFSHPPDGGEDIALAEARHLHSFLETAEVTSIRLFLLRVLIASFGLMLVGRATAQTYTNFYHFGQGSDGVFPDAELILSGGTLYGTASQGGTLGTGSVFAMSSDGTSFTNLHTFAAVSPILFGTKFTNSDGFLPEAGLVLSSNALYGTASSGGTWGSGTMFTINTNGSGFAVLHTFTATIGSGINTDGAAPRASLILSGSTLYGTASGGGSSGGGTIFSLQTDGSSFANLHNFNTIPSSGTPANIGGASPRAGLILSGNTLYGTASGGGTSGAGTLFAINTNGSGFTVLHNFAGYPSDGANPNAGLILSGNMLYGTANVGGSSSNGMMFAVNINGSGFTNLYNFTATSGSAHTNSDGAGPSGLVLLGNTLYGTASVGGSSGGGSGAGTVFSIHTDGSGFTVLHTFVGPPGDGYEPRARLLLSGNTLYGTTRHGGNFISNNSGYGTVFKLSLSTLTITPLRVNFSAANVSPADSIDAPIIPFTDTNKLATVTNTLGLGVVADGVTPVLFQITGPPGNYSLAVTNDATNIVNGTLAGNLFALQNNSWVQTTNFTITSSGDTGVTYVYLQGLEWTNFAGLSPANEVNVSLSAAQTNSSVPLAQSTFKIRPPPIALVHGYNSDSTSWSPAFLQILYGYVPTNFVIAVNYGTNGNNNENSYGQLQDLAPLLDTELDLQMEGPLHNQWAFTRYDVVAHSQGGVLIRMLCQNLPDGTPMFGLAKAGGPLFAVVGPFNDYRGRFRRVITIGSPHNGSLILHYILQMRAINPGLLRQIPKKGPMLGRLLQQKFDPFGLEIAVINNSIAQVDPHIKFCCISATIASGQPPTEAYNPTFYVALGLCQFQPMLNKTAGQYLLPRGSDGIVDFDSQGGGMGTSGKVIANTPAMPVNIVHADKLPSLFGVGSGQSEASDSRVASIVTNLLSGPTNAFGAFVLPKLLSANQRALVDSLVPQITPIDIIYSWARPNIPTTNFYFQAQLPVGVPSGGILGWDVEVFGTNGVSSDGVSLQVNTNDSSQVTVSVNTDILGTVVLYAYYGSTNGMLFVGNPTIVFRNPAGDTLGGISLDPQLVTLPLGGIVDLDVWGNYTNGASSLLYLPTGAVIFSSSDTNVATVDVYGTITVNSYGSANITALYNGFTAQSTVQVTLPSIGHFLGQQSSNSMFLLSFTGTAGTTNIIQASTNLVDWIPVAAMVNTNGFLQYTDFLSTNFPARYYRVEIP